MQQPQPCGWGFAMGAALKRGKPKQRQPGTFRMCLNFNQQANNSPKSDLCFDQAAPIVPTRGLSRAPFWRFSDLALAEARDVISEIENLHVVDRSEHLSPD
jgi:hypothetical protein